MNKYHAHIYFDLQDMDLAQLLFQKAKSQEAIFKTYKLYDKLVGPHPKPNFELNFTSETLKETLGWLKANVGDWSVLVHQDTGDDYRDHTVGFLWLGKELPIDFSFFDLVKEDPSKLIHQN